MCAFHESTCNGFGDIWWTDNPIYFSGIDSCYGSGHLMDPTIVFMTAFQKLLLPVLAE